jgi:beta-glucosidase
VLLAVGESADMTGEAASRTDIGLPDLQGKLFDAVTKAGKPIVLIVFSARPLVLAPYVEKAAAIVQAWHPGIQGGPALVRVLSGEANFSGRLTVSMPRSVGQLPLYYNHLNTGRPAGNVDTTRPPKKGEEKFVSRYMDQQNTPLYPFGYGLSYTQFEYTKPTVSTSSLSAKALNSNSQTVKIAAQVRNTGTRDGVEVAQLYIRQRGTSVARPVRELKGFQRVPLAAGESRQIEFTLGKDELGFWNATMKHVSESALVSVWISKDAHSGERVELTITE